MTPIVEGFPAAAMCPSSAWPERGIEAIGNETNRLRAGGRPLNKTFSHSPQRSGARTEN